MDLQLQGKRAFVTGATRGIGLAIAERLGAEGCAVAICGRHRATLSTALAALSAQGIRAIGRSIDVADTAALRGWTEDAARELGGLDIYVANASALVSGSDDASWRGAFDVDIMATVRGVEAAKPFLAASGAGAIIIIGSIASTLATWEVGAYAAGKAALLPWMKGLAKSLARSGIRVNCVSPGPVLAEGGIWDHLSRSDPAVYNAMVGAIPRGRLGEPGEIADLVCFLASPRASFISGANVVADGARSSLV